MNSLLKMTMELVNWVSVNPELTSFFFISVIVLWKTRTHILWLGNKYRRWRGKHSFYESFVRMRSEDGEGLLRYPKTKWKSKKLGNIRIKKAVLEISGLFENIETLRKNIDIFSAEFKKFFVEVNYSNNPGTFDFIVDSSKELKNRLPISIINQKNNEEVAIGYTDDLNFVSIPLFKSIAGVLRVIGPSGFGKSTVIDIIFQSIDREAVETYLVTTKNGPLSKYKENNVRFLNQIVALDQVYKLVKSLEGRALQRLNALNEGKEIEDNKKILLVIDEALDLIWQGKSGTEEEKIRLEITEILAKAARLFRDTNIFVILCLQDPAADALPKQINVNSMVLCSGISRAYLKNILDTDDPPMGRDGIVKQGEWIFYSKAQGILRRLTAFDPDK